MKRKRGKRSIGDVLSQNCFSFTYPKVCICPLYVNRKKKCKMLLNSPFTGLFSKRLIVRSGVAIVMLSILLTASSFRKHSDPDLRIKQVNLIIRQIGHRLLLQGGDATSRVLPVTMIKEGTFLLKFEKEFTFSHDSLIELSKELLPKTEFPSGYTVTVHDCAKGDIVYGFQFNNISQDILACSGRSQPAGCYSIEFAFPDFYENAEQKKADINQLTALARVNPQRADSKLEELKTKTSDDNRQGTKGLNSVKVDHEEVNPKLKELKTTIADYPSGNVIYGSVLALVVVVLLIWRFGKVLKPVPVQNTNHFIIKESVPELPALGKFLFDVRDQCLLLGSEVIPLTDKECNVLELLHQNFGELIPRDTLMQKVWIDEGVITTRSLDMFVSKLRKKLSRDPRLGISNVHGKGYKLEYLQDRLPKIQAKSPPTMGEL
jgi:hypothetical protein